MSESPTHPDAPRAGGETPPIDLEATRQRLDEIERRNIDPHAARVHYLTQADLRWLLESIRAALPSLLERHRDGERLDWLERAVPSGEFRDFCNALHNQWPGSVRQLIDAAMSAGPSPERASK